MNGIHWTHIIIHHSATPDGGFLDYDAIRMYHMRKRGWRDVGYHFIIEAVGGVYVAIVGRPLTERGAHCRAHGMNRKAIGVCFVGNFSLVRPPTLMLEVGVKRVIRPMMVAFSIPKSHILGHRDFAATECPGLHFDMERLREMI